MPIAYNTLHQQADILSANRHQWYFPDITGVNGEQLRILNTSLTFPALAVEHIQVKILNHSVGFAGGQSFENTIEAVFYENIQGATTRSFVNWLNLIRDPTSTVRRPKSEYAARTSNIVLYDTTGVASLEFEAKNVFPLNVTLPEVTDETTAAQIRVSLNVDVLLLKQGTRTGPPLSPGQTATQYAGFF